MLAKFKGKIMLEPEIKHKSLKDRLKNYNGEYQCTEWDTGKSVGSEVL